MPKILQELQRREFTELPAWTFSLPIPETEEEWRVWAQRLRNFVGARLGISQGRFAEVMGVSRTAAGRWIAGSPMNWDNQNILSCLIYFVDTRGVEDAIKTVEENREYLRNFAPGPWHMSELRTLKDRIASLERGEETVLALTRRLTDLEAKAERYESSLVSLNQALVAMGVPQ